VIPHVHERKIPFEFWECISARRKRKEFSEILSSKALITIFTRFWDSW
jgi:hypothetical protein